MLLKTKAPHSTQKTALCLALPVCVQGPWAGPESVSPTSTLALSGGIVAGLASGPGWSGRDETKLGVAPSPWELRKQHFYFLWENFPGSPGEQVGRKVGLVRGLTSF